jgi:hypothetical protein
MVAQIPSDQLPEYLVQVDLTLKNTPNQMQALDIPSALTVLCTTQNGREKWEAESELYSTVSFSAPSNIASSKSMAAIQTQNKPQYDIQQLNIPRG